MQYAEEQARVEKERSELDVMKLERELEKLQYQVRMVKRKTISNNFPQCQRWSCWRRGAPAELGIVATAAVIDPEAGEKIEETENILNRRLLVVMAMTMMTVAIQGKREARTRSWGAG